MIWEQVPMHLRGVQLGERFRGVNAPGGTRVKHMNYRRGDVVGIAVDCTEDTPFFSFFVTAAP
jgi:hypothetical protein